MLRQLLAVVSRPIIPGRIVEGEFLPQFILRNLSLKSVLETYCWNFNSVFC